MEINEMNLEEVIARMNAIPEELKKEGADIDALETEANSLIERKNHLIAQKKAEVKAVIEDQGETITENVERTHTMENVITRNSPEYINAYAEAIKKQDETIVRSLLTENVQTGTIAVPDVVADFVKEAWESNEIWRRVPKTYLRGNYKIQYEINAPIAVPHIEGTEAIDEENLQLGIVNLQPVYFKKYVKVSDEAMSLTGEAFLQYIYAEVTDRIIASVINGLINDILYNSDSSQTGVPHVAFINGAIANTDIINAIGQLKGELRDVVVMTSRSAYAQYKALQFAAGYAIDIFDGLEVLFTDQLPTGVRAIVGSLRDGAHANLPNGPEVEFKIDSTSLALTSADMVGILGRLFAGVGVVRDGAFCVIGQTGNSGDGGSHS